MKNSWKISLSNKENERIAITYGDPADSLKATDNYARKPLPEAIENWQAIVTLLKPDHWYDITCFYSQRKTDIDKESARLLYEYNQRAYDAAKEKGGLILYYQGTILSPAKETISDNLNLSYIPNCLSFCIWNTLSEAKEGANVSAHKKATTMISRWYNAFSIVKYRLKFSRTNGKSLFLFEQTFPE
jgi:hypothetical protein